MKKGLLLLLILSFAFPLYAQQNREEGKNKMGASYYAHSGALYVLSNKTTGYEVTGVGPLIGAAFFYERIFLSRFSMGLTYTSLMERSMDVKDGVTDINVVEKVALGSVDFRAYFKSHKRNGWKPYLGVSFGTMSASDTLTLTTAGSTTTTEETTKAVVPVTLLRGGFDLIMDYGGIRLDFGQVTGVRRDLVGSNSYRANYKMTGSSMSIAVFSHF